MEEPKLEGKKNTAWTETMTLQFILDLFWDFLLWDWKKNPDSFLSPSACPSILLNYNKKIRSA